MTRMYGCHNHAPFKPTVEVQDGWTTATMPGVVANTRRPRMVQVPFRMSMECRYDLQHTDERCAGCCHVAPPQQMEISLDAGRKFLRSSKNILKLQSYRNHSLEFQMPDNRYNPNVRHLDTAIAILGAGKQNRKPRTQSVHLIDLGGVFAVQVNGKMVAQFVDHAEARADATRRADKVGVTVLEY